MCQTIKVGYQNTCMTVITAASYSDDEYKTMRKKHTNDDESKSRQGYKIVVSE